jgi:hypothetical protein
MGAAVAATPFPLWSCSSFFAPLMYRASRQPGMWQLSRSGLAVHFLPRRATGRG